MSVFKLPAPSPTLPRNGFDLSTRRVFSAPAGALLPVLCEEVNPGEKFRINVQDLVRTQPLNTAAFARCKEYYHFFFVPYKALWMHSDRFFTGVTNGDSTFIDPSNSVVTGYKDAQNVKIYNSIPREVPNFNLYQLYSFLIKSAPNDKTKTVQQRIDLVKSAIKPFQQLAKYPTDKEYISATDSLGFLYTSGAARLLNLMEFGIRSDLKHFNQTTKSFDYSVLSSTGNESYKVSAFRPLAYQRIYNDFYRNDQWEQSDPSTYNVDYLYNGGTINFVDTYKMFQLRYRWLQKDWLTSGLPTINYNSGIFELPTYNNTESNSITADTQSTNIDTTGHGRVSVADIKAAFALDKMLEATRRANGLDYSSQIAAHFGFNVPESRRNCAQFIGGFDNAISISEVISTASGSTDSNGSNASVTGQMFGKGIGSMQSGSLEYDVKEHGIIMCIYSIAPQVDYNADHISSFNRKLTRNDYFQPEFMNLGLQPILQSDLCFSSGDAKFNNSILGYTSRYAEYKTSRDLVFNGFQTDGELSAWTTPRQVYFTQGTAVGGTDTAIGLPNTSPAFLSVSNFLVNPSVLDPIFSVKYNGLDSTDQFMVNSYFDIKAVRPMSVVGSTNL